MGEITSPVRYWTLETCAVLAYLGSLPAGRFTSGKELTERLGLTNTTVYRALRRFADGGLLEVMDDPPYVYYRLASQGRERASEAVATLRAHPLAAFLAGLVRGATEIRE
jgi:DNA-binding MarR family transcriptional regulator